MFSLPVLKYLTERPARSWSIFDFIAPAPFFVMIRLVHMFPRHLTQWRWYMASCRCRKEMLDNRSGSSYYHPPTRPFESQPLTVSFEMIGRNTYAKVRYRKSIYDLIDYYPREWDRQERKMRVCGNCGKYFSIIGWTHAECCDRVFDSKSAPARTSASLRSGHGKRTRMQSSRHTVGNTKVERIIKGNAGLSFEKLLTSCIATLCSSVIENSQLILYVCKTPSRKPAGRFAVRKEEYMI